MLRKLQMFNIFRYAAVVDHQRLLHRYQIILIITGFLYPFWRFVYTWLLPDSYDSFVQRLPVGLCMLGFGIGSYYSSHIRAKIHLYFYVAVLSMWLHCFWLIWKNDMHVGYVLGGYVVLFCSGSAFLSPGSILAYFIVAIACTTAAVVEKTSFERVIFLGGTVTSAVIAFIGNSAFLKLLTELHNRTNEFLELSAAVQGMFLPEAPFLKNERVNLQSYYRPVDKCGGDWWWFSQQGADKYQILIGDVTGHGPGPAMLTASISSYFRVIKNFLQDADISEMLTQLNSQIVSNTPKDNKNLTYIMTLSMVEIDLKRQTLRACFAGSPPIYIFSQDGGTQVLSSPGTHMGIPEFQLGEEEVSIQPGDRIVLYTDGIVEAANDKKVYGDRRMLKALKQRAQDNAESAVKNVIDNLDEFRGEVLQDDDYTLIVIDILKPAEALTIDSQNLKNPAA